MNAELVLFWGFAACTVISTLWVILARNPINSAMFLVATFFFLAGIYVLLLAHTIAVLQILVYAGAIMVLFLFVIMLLSLGDEGARPKLTVSRSLGAAACAALLAGLVVVLQKSLHGSAPRTPAASFGTIQRLGEVLYTQYLLPFEAVSLLLLAAMVGAVVVAKSRI